VDIYAKTVPTEQKLRGIFPDDYHPNNLNPFLKKINPKGLQNRNRRLQRASAWISDRKSSVRKRRRSYSNDYKNKRYSMTLQGKIFSSPIQ
jgi:hypothetical protein